MQIHRDNETKMRQAIATMNHHYRAADALAKVGKLADAESALAAAERCRYEAIRLETERPVPFGC